MEFLEHIDDDVKLIDLLNPGVKVILTVPNNETVINGKPKGYPIHRRVYNKEIIKSRYSIDFNSIEVYRNWIIAIGIKK
jgi:hypothetical protein